MYTRFADRREAGKRLADSLGAYQGDKNAVVLALPRGGVAVAAEVAATLKLPLDLMLVRKIGMPGDEEFAIGAVAIGDVLYLNEDTVRAAKITPDTLNKAIEQEKGELLRRNEIYRSGAPAPDVKGKTVILIDDGIATGADMRVATRAARLGGAAKVVAAAPVSSEAAFDLLKKDADEAVCLHVPRFFAGVGAFYEDFTQVSDGEVLILLAQV